MCLFSGPEGVLDPVLVQARPVVSGRCLMTVAASSPLHIATHGRGAVQVLTVEGVLDSTTYRTLRNAIIKAALAEPAGVVVDITLLQIPAPSACAVFTSARWEVSRWPDVPVLLACELEERRKVLLRNGIGRYVPIHADVESAADFVGLVSRGRVRRRARVQLLRSRGSLDEAKSFVIECLLEWSHQDLIPAAKVIVTELVRNVLTHTDSAPALRVESDSDRVTIAVDDESMHPAALLETTCRRRVSGLQLVAALSRGWGSSTSSTGKTVWATIDPAA
ncbi:MAG: ATP-binding protein [Mycobacterium sp.]